MKQRILSLLLVLAMVLSMIPAVSAADCGITVTEPKPGPITVGSLYSLPLTEVFTDPNGHTLTYELTEDSSGRAYIKDGTLYFTTPNVGSYSFVVTASCPEGGVATATVALTVEASDTGGENQYSYDETDQKVVRVYVTISNNGVPIRGSDGTVLSHLAVDVPFFPLEYYGLSDLNRYHTENGSGNYIDGVLVERPTALHLYIYLLERYYLGIPEEKCCKGTSGLLDYVGDGSGVYDIFDNSYEDTLSALYITGSATSMYMQNFWGHDENLMYYRNHVYPLMGPGWGSTADYVLLSDGDTIDLGMFSNWNFWQSGAFACFDKDDYAVVQGGQVAFRTQKYDTKSVADGGSEKFETITDLSVSLYNADWSIAPGYETLVSDASDGYYILDTTRLEPGVYYLLGMDENMGTDDACIASATAKLVVKCPDGEHKWNDGVAAKEKTCTEPGELLYTCTRCGATKTEVVPAGHIAVTDPAVEATCLNAGKTEGSHCSVCGEVLVEQKEIPALGHDYDENAVCKRCGTVGGYLSVLRATTANRSGDCVLLPASEDATHDFIVFLPDTANNIYLWATLSDLAPDGSTIKAEWVNLYSNKTQSTAITSGKTSGQSLANFGRDGKTNTVTLTVGKDGRTQNYTLTSARTPTLSALTATDSHFTASFTATTLEYTADTTAETVTVAATPYGEDYTVTYNGADSGELVLEVGENKVEIVVSNGAYETTYTLTIIRHATRTLRISATPESAVILLIDNYGDRIWPDDTGAYAVADGYTYTCTATASGCVGKQEILTVNDETEDLTFALEQAAANETIDPNLSAAWPNFRNGENHLGITEAPTPYSPDDAELLWAAKYGTGWAAAPGAPILVDGDLITYTGSTIKRLDVNTGKVLAEGTMAGTSSFSINPATYAEGMIFVGLSGGKIQAFNAKTLESLWVYTDPVGGQPNTSPTYKDGYIYVGFWNGESKPGNFVALSVTDEDPTQTTEAKYASWSYSCNGGFYWAGAYVTDKYCIVGTDDGSGEGNYINTSAMLVLDRTTGRVIDAHYGCSGDIRSNVSYDPDSDRVFFTSKGGYLYNAKIDWETGTIIDFKQFSLTDADGYTSEEKPGAIMSTCTPSVFNGRIYLGVSGNRGQFAKNAGHCIEVIDLDVDTGEMTQAYSYGIVGYPQTSAMVTTAYEAETGYVYIYLPYNYTPGGISVLKDRKGQTEPLTTTDSGYSEVFTPVGPLAQCCICSTVADEYGTIYYKNDSCYMMAITSKILGIEVVEQPAKRTYNNEVFDPAGMKVVAKLANGLERDVTEYVTWDTAPISADATSVTLTYTYGFDNANYGLKHQTAEIKLLKQTEVETSAQAEGAFLLPAAKTTVLSDLSDRYGYADRIDSSVGVSALDVLIRTHELMFGEDFTPETAQAYLVVENGMIKTIFGVETSACSFAVNDLYPVSDKTSSYGGYEGYTIADCPIKSGDSVSFFLYRDTDMWSDLYTWYEKDGEVVRNITVKTDDDFTLTIRGYMFGLMGYMYKDYNDIIADQNNTVAVEEGQLALVDPETGVLTDIKDAVTDENGTVTLSLGEGEHILAVYSGEDAMFPTVLTFLRVTAEGHAMTGTVVPATCDKEGYTEHACKYCGYNYRDTFTPAGIHDYTAEVTKEATCTETGVRTYTCANCGGSYTETIEKLPHSYEAVVTAPTCTAMGYTTYTCKACGVSYIDSVTEAKGHAYEAVVTASTCTAAGYTTHTCSVCGDSYVDSVVEAKGHAYETSVTAPTCDTMGYTTYTCKLCGDTYRTAYTPAKDHTYTVEVTVQPTCTVEGVKTFTCADCGKSYTEPVAKLAHSYEAVETAPTCTTMGYTTYTCAACGESYRDDYTDAVGHDCEQTVTEATCIGYGFTVNTCKNCDYTFVSSVVAPLGHNEVVDAAVEATCTEPGKTEGKHCSVCKEVFAAQETVPAKGHAFEGGICTVCGAKDPDWVAPWVNPFRDVTQSDWFYEGVRFAAQHELFNGASADTFSPNVPMTRGMLVTVLWRLDGKTEAAKTGTFVDVSAKEYYADAVAWAAENGIVNGVDATHFAPNDEVTREQIAAILFRYAEKKDADTAKRADLSAFPDAKKVSGYAKDALAWANAAGLIKGSSENGRNYLDPQGSADRAQVAVILMRYLED